MDERRRPAGGDIAPIKFLRPAVMLLVLMTFLTWIGREGALEPHQVLDARAPVLEGVLTHPIFHTNGLHLFLNMLVILIAGGVLESYWGTARFLFFCMFVAGGSALAFAGLGSLAIASGAFVGSPVVTYGGSAVALGCLVCMAVAFPHGYIVRGLSIRHLVWSLIFFGSAGLTFLDYLASSAPEAEETVRGSFLVCQVSGVGFALFYLWGEPRLRIRLRNLSVKRQVKHRQKVQEIRARVDQLLDKINDTGYDSLTLAEKAFLKQASKHYKPES